MKLSLKPLRHLFLPAMAGLLMLLNGVPLLAQPSRVPGIGRPPACCRDYPWKLTSSAESLIESFRSLVTGLGVNNCNTKENPIPGVASAMAAKYYTGSQLAGMVTFVSFYEPKNRKDVFRVTWASNAHNSLGFRYYGVCPPDPIVFPAGLSENHVYGAKLIPFDDYLAFKGPVRNYSTMLSVPGLNIADIADIINVYVEGNDGYTAAVEQDSYDYPFSSKGIVVVVALRNGRWVSCYLLNNYDSGTLVWKEKNRCEEGRTRASDERLRQPTGRGTDGVDKAPSAVAEAELFQNSPNPIQQETTIAYHLPDRAG